MAAERSGLAERVAMTAPLVLLGASTCWLLFSEVEQQLASIAAGCPDSVTHSFRFGSEELDKFVCALVLFFKSALKTREGLWILGYLLSVAISALAFMAVEASRYKHGWLLSLTPVYALLFQVAGISVVVPCLWLPIYIISNAADRSMPEIWKKKISPQRVAAIKFFLIFLEFIAIAMLIPLNKLNQDSILFAFQFAPIIAAALWLPFATTETSNQVLGHKAVMLLHSLQAGGALMWHLVGILLVIEDPGILVKTAQLFWHHPGHLWCQFFLVIDCIVLFATLVYQSALEDGILAALLILSGAFLVGPGAALSLYYIYREQSILKISSLVSESNKKTR